MPRLRVVAGTSLSDLKPITVNSGTTSSLSSSTFEGQVLAYIKDFTDSDGNVLESEYFDREDRKGVTWSIQVQGVLMACSRLLPFAVGVRGYENMAAACPALKPVILLRAASC
jgi:hypothetical protein